MGGRKSLYKVHEGSPGISKLGVARVEGGTRGDETTRGEAYILWSLGGGHYINP